MLAIRHKWVKSEMEERISQSGASGRSVGNSIEDSVKRTNEWLDASLINSPRHVASPCPSQSSLTPNPTSPMAEAGFAPVLSRKKTSSTASKTIPKTKATTPIAKTTPAPVPRSKVAAPTPKPRASLNRGPTPKENGNEDKWSVVASKTKRSIETTPEAPRTSKTPKTPETLPLPSYLPPFTGAFGEDSEDDSKLKISTKFTHRANEAFAEKTSTPRAQPEVTPVEGKGSEDATTTLVRIQSQQLAYGFLVNLRPKSPFDGESRWTLNNI